MGKGSITMSESVNRDELELTNETISKQTIHMEGDDDRYGAFELDVKVMIHDDTKPEHKQEFEINGKIENDSELSFAPLMISEIPYLTSESNGKLLPNGNLEKQNPDTVQANQIRSSSIGIDVLINNEIKPLDSVTSYSEQIPTGPDVHETSAASIAKSSTEPEQATESINSQHSTNPSGSMSSSVMLVEGNLPKINHSVERGVDVFYVESNVSIQTSDKPLLQSKQVWRDIDLDSNINQSVTSTPFLFENAQRANKPDSFDCQLDEFSPSPILYSETSVENPDGNVCMEHISSQDDSSVSLQIFPLRSQEINGISTDINLRSLNISASVSNGTDSLANGGFTTKPIGFGSPEMKQIPSTVEDPEPAENSMEYKDDPDVERLVVNNKDIQTQSSRSPFVVDKSISLKCDESITNGVDIEIKQLPSHSGNSEITNSEQKPDENGIRHNWPKEDFLVCNEFPGRLTDSKQFTTVHELQPVMNQSASDVTDMLSLTCGETVTNPVVVDSQKEIHEAPYSVEKPPENGHKSSESADVFKHNSYPSQETWNAHPEVTGQTLHPLYNVSGEICGLISESALRNTSRGINISNKQTIHGQENVSFVNTDINGWQHFDAHENVSARNSSVENLELWEQLLEYGVGGAKEPEVVTLHTVSEEPDTLQNHQFGMASPRNPFIEGSDRTSHFSEADALQIFGLQHSFDTNNKPFSADIFTENSAEPGSKQTLTNYPSFSDLPVPVVQTTQPLNAPSSDKTSDPSAPALNIGNETNGDNWVASFDINVPAPQEMSRSVSLPREGNDQQNGDNMSPNVNPMMKVVSNVRNMKSFGDDKAAAQKSIWTVCFCS